MDPQPYRGMVPCTGMLVPMVLRTILQETMLLPATGSVGCLLPMKSSFGEHWANGCDLWVQLH